MYMYYVTCCHTYILYNRLWDYVFSYYLKLCSECACVLNIAKHSLLMTLQIRTTLCGPPWPDASSVAEPFSDIHEI